MMKTVKFPAETGSQVVRAGQIQMMLPFQPVRYYRHGWQSWSLAAWTGLRPLPIPKPTLFHVHQYDLEYARERKPNGSWLGAVEFEDGSFILLGAIGLDAHVSLDGDQLTGVSEVGEVDWLVAHGDERTVFTEYAQRLSECFGETPHKPAPRIWCSWYSLYTYIDEWVLASIFDQMGDLPFDVLQVDDGWQKAVGDWEPNSKFPSGMQTLAEKIKSTGRKAGLWLAPLIAVESSTLFREHPDWFLHDAQGHFVQAGFNWGEPFFALDTTHPAVAHWLIDLMTQIRTWGYDYLKLDFLYGGALKAVRYQNMPREQAYRAAVRLMREAMGSDAYFLTCGTPILPALGLCDAMRIGQDVSGEWENTRDARYFYNPGRPGLRNAIRTSFNRLWLKSLVVVDPDVVYFTTKGNRLTSEQKTLMQDLAMISGFKATSDLPQWLTPHEREQLRGFLQAQPVIRQIDHTIFERDGRRVDFSQAISLPEVPQGLDAVWGAILGKLANEPLILKLNHRIEDLQRRKLLASLGVYPVEASKK